MIITLEFPMLNVSVQRTDVVYACLTQNDQAGINTPGANVNTKPFAIGVVDVVRHNDNEIDVDDTGYPSYTLTNNHYFFFSKDNRANMSGILGYFALVEYRNGSKKQVEIFATGAEYASSSK